MDEFGRTDIFYSISKGDKEKFLQELGEINDIDIVDSNGMNLLFFACCHNQVVIAEKLIDNGIKIDSPDKFGNTPLWRATFECKGKNYDLVELLVKNGANINSTNNARKSPIMFAETIGDQKLISILKKEK